MIKIQLHKNFYIESDTVSFQLVEYQTSTSGKNKGDVSRRAIGFYGSLKALLKCVPETLVKRDDITSFTELRQKLEFYETLLESIYKDTV